MIVLNAERPSWFAPNEMSILRKTFTILTNLLDIDKLHASVSLRFLAHHNNMGVPEGHVAGGFVAVGSKDPVIMGLFKHGLGRTMLSLCHETVHAKQNLTGEAYIDGGEYVFQGKRYSTVAYQKMWESVPQQDLPWEIEPLRLQEELFKSVALALPYADQCTVLDKLQQNQ
jgi:hypothetical protein